MAKREGTSGIKKGILKRFFINVCAMATYMPKFDVTTFIGHNRSIMIIIMYNLDKYKDNVSIIAFNTESSPNEEGDKAGYTWHGDIKDFNYEAYWDKMVANIKNNTYERECE